MAFISTVHAAQQQPRSSEQGASLCKPSDLPIYGPLRKPAQKRNARQQQDSGLHHSIENGVRYMRKELQTGYNTVADQAGTISVYVETAKEHTQRSLDYLNEPQNSLHRSGAIVMGGLAGFIFAARGGFVKKVVYTGIGAGAVASLCYPRQAEENARVVLYEGRKIFAVAYNFIKGVKPGEAVPIEPIKKFPTSLGELKFLALELYDDAKDAIFTKKK